MSNGVTPETVAMAVVVAANHYHLDPVKTVSKGNLARYMAMRLLMRAFPEQSKMSLARMVGYSPKTAQVMGSPSQQPPRFRVQMLDQLYEVYQSRLQENASVNATQPQLAHVQLTEEEVQTLVEPIKKVGALLKTVGMLPPKENEVTPFEEHEPDHDHTLETFLHKPEPPRKEIEPFVQVSARVTADPRRKALEETLRNAVLNTGGKLVD